MITCIIPHARSQDLLWATQESVWQSGVDAVCVFHDDVHIGPARAREEGARLASAYPSDYLFFLDDDSIVPPGIFSDVPDADCVIYPSTCHGTPVFYHHLHMTDDLPESLLDYPIATEPLSDKPYPCISGPNGAFLIKRSVWEDIGGYGGKIDGYGPDEPVLGFRLRAKGYRTVLDPRYIVWHKPSYESYKNRDEAFLKRHEDALRELRGA